MLFGVVNNCIWFHIVLFCPQITSGQRTPSHAVSPDCSCTFCVRLFSSKHTNTSPENSLSLSIWSSWRTRQIEKQHSLQCNWVSIQGRVQAANPEVTFSMSLVIRKDNIQGKRGRGWQIDSRDVCPVILMKPEWKLSPFNSFKNQDSLINA